jgi:outer membrane protein assembly factor BamB
MRKDLRMKLRVLSAVLLMGLAAAANAADVSEFRGKDRAGMFEEKGLLKAWPEAGPPVAWVAKGLGVGYSSALVHKGRVYVTGTLAEQESSVFVLDLEGKLIEQISYGKETDAARAPGARSTPTIDGEQLFVLSGLGVATCIDLPKKQVVWQVNILERFKGSNNEWSLSESLLVDGSNVICTPGGEDAVMAALDRKTGETVWVTKGLTDMAAYVAPVLVTHKGRRIILTETSKYLICVDAASGALLWKHDHPTQYDIHAVTPLYKDGFIYYVGGYKSGGGKLKLSDDATSVETVWTDIELDCQHHGVVLVDGYLYGASHHRGGGQMVCLDWATGRMMWSTRDISQAVVIYADGMLYTYEGPKKGIVSLVKPSPTGLERVSSFTLAEGTMEHWAHPTIANGRLYVRHGDALVCYDITAK